jgi:hypothetical protein
MPAGIVLITFAFFGALLGLSYLVLFLLNRFIHRYAAIAAGTAWIAYLGYSTISGLVYCSAEPVYVPPRLGELGDGQMISNCDSAGGAITRMVYFLTIPTIAILGWMTLRITHTSVRAFLRESGH